MSQLAIVDEPGVGRLQIWPLPTDEATLLALVTDIFARGISDSTPILWTAPAGGFDTVDTRATKVSADTLQLARSPSP